MGDATLTWMCFSWPIGGQFRGLEVFWLWVDIFCYQKGPKANFLETGSLLFIFLLWIQLVESLSLMHSVLSRFSPWNPTPEPSSPQKNPQVIFAQFFGFLLLLDNGAFGLCVFSFLKFHKRLICFSLFIIVCIKKIGPSYSLSHYWNSFLIGSIFSDNKSDILKFYIFNCKEINSIICHMLCFFYSLI